MRPALAMWGGWAALLAFPVFAGYVAVFEISKTPLASPVGHALLVVLYALALLVLAATKARFNAAGFRAADRVILPIMALPGLAAILVLLVEYAGLLGGSVLALSDPIRAGTIQPRFFVVYAFPVVWSVLGIMFGIRTCRYARTAGGLWSAIGRLYIVGWSFVLAGLLVGVTALFGQSMAVVFFGGWSAIVLAFVGATVLAAGRFCHGLGLFAAARQLRDGRSA